MHHPGALGAYLRINNDIVSFLSDKIQPADIKVLGITVGSCTSQQVCEGLGALVALRTWKSRWRADRMRLVVKGDSVAMLTIAITMQSSGMTGLNIIAREMALDRAESVYEPDLGSHVPGIANIIADGLSRRHDPSKNKWIRPTALSNAVEVTVPNRDESWYRTRKKPVTGKP